MSPSRGAGHSRQRRRRNVGRHFAAIPADSTSGIDGDSIRGRGKTSIRAFILASHAAGLIRIETLIEFSQARRRELPKA
jgi:hypothetical protein